MNPSLVFWLTVCFAGFVLSVRSAAVLRSRSRWTIAGWVATAVYFAIVATATTRVVRYPTHFDYVALAALTLAFIVAGVRDEPQAEPWYWPTAPGKTGAERRAARGN